MPVVLDLVGDLVGQFFAVEVADESEGHVDPRSDTGRCPSVAVLDPACLRHPGDLLTSDRTLEF